MELLRIIYLEWIEVFQKISIGIIHLLFFIEELFILLPITETPKKILFPKHKIYVLEFRMWMFLSPYMTKQEGLSPKTTQFSA